MTQAERKELKAGKHERIRMLLDNLRAKQPKSVLEDQLTMGEDVKGLTPSQETEG